MADNIEIQNISPNTFEYQEYSNNDIALINENNIDVTFDPNQDYIEYFAYDLNGNIVIENVTNYPYYSLLNNQVNIDPIADLARYSYEQGQFNVLYNFLRKKLASSPLDTYFIEEISTDRTEIRLNSTTILEGDMIGSADIFSQEINDSPFDYLDFYLDFGNNKLVIANNLLLDLSNPSTPSILIKLYEPLPSEFGIKSECWVVEKIATSVAYYISILPNFNDIDDNIYLRGPNTNISIKDQINNSTNYSSYNSLSSTNNQQGTGSFQYQINSLLAESGIELNIDYSNYNNFIHFSSAQTRLENFYYKLALLETYQASASLSSGTTTNYYVSASNVVWQNKIDEIITGFDGYEYYLYFESGSTSWPKTNNTPPYTNASTTSVAGQAFLLNQATVAGDFDLENSNALVNTIPGYLREDPNNAQYELFVEMIGQHFDNIFIYIQDVTQKYNADNRLNYGVSKDIVADVLRDMGVKIYQNNFSSDDLYSALLGFTPSGSLYNLPYTTGSLPTPSGWEYINTYVTASSTSSLEPTDDINKSIYKRLYHNLPYLLKKKGTVAGLKALITIYGIPDTILQINEFGGQNRIDENDYDLWFDQFNYAYDTLGTNYISSSFSDTANPLWIIPGFSAINTLQFRFQTRGIPTDTGYYNQVLWSTGDSSPALLRLRYTGSGYASGSYSGSIPNTYNEYVHLDFIPDASDLNTSASVYLPFFDGDWWNVMVSKDTPGAANFILYAGNKTTPGGNYNTYQFLASASVNGNDTPWTDNSFSYFPATSNSALGRMFSGSYQEIRYYNEPLTVDPFEDYIMYPYSIDSNGVNTAPDTLLFRAALGGELYTSSLSIHPKVTGSWVTTSSFVSGNSFFISNTSSFVTNKEYVYPNQFPSGIKNRVSNKIRQQNEVLPYSGSNEVNLPTNQVLSPFISIQQNVFESGSYTPNIDYVEVAFSPQNEINNDIAGQLGYFNIGEYIGDPRLVSSSAESYPELNALRNYYFEKYTGNYNIWDYIRLIKFFDNSLFKMIQDWIPARTSAATGIVIKQTVLERNKYPVPQPNITSSIANVASASTNIPWQVENIYITGSPIQMYEISASTGGTMPDLFGLTQSFYTGNNVVNITQSWTGSTTSLLGLVPFTQTSQTEFYDGELSGSFIQVENGELNEDNPYKLASTQLIPYQISGSSSPNPGSGIITWQGSIGYNGIIYYLYVSSLYINEVDSSGNSIQTALSNLQTGNQITFRIIGSVSDLGPPVADYGYTSTTLTGLITSVVAVSPTVWKVNFSQNLGSQAIYYYSLTNPWQNTNWVDNQGSNTALSIVLDPFLNDSSDFNNSPFNPIINNALTSRFNDEFFDVDFSSNAITAVNRLNIISASRGTGSATPSTIPASNYTTARITRPRYNGSKNTSPGVNIISGSQLPSVEQLTSYFIYTPGGLGNTLAERSGSGNYKVGYIIDELGNTISADPTSSNYLPSFIDAFAAGTTVVLSPTTNQTVDITEYTVYKPAVVSEILLYNDTGSLGNNFLVSGTYNPIYFTVTPGAYTNPFATEITQSTIQTVPTSNIVTMSFDEVVLDQALGWSISSDSYYVSSSQPYRAKITASFTVDNLVGGGSVITNLMNNGTILDTFSFTSTGVIPVQLDTLVFPKEGDRYWVRVNNQVGSSIDLNNTSPGEFTITPVTSSITASSPWFTTGTTISSVLTSSIALGNAYGGGFNQVGFANSGFDNPSPLTIQPYDEIRFEGKESKVSLIVSSSVNTSVSSPRFFIHLSEPIDTSAININYFAFRRWSFAVDNLILNSPGTVMGAGLILPKYPSPTLIQNLPSIVENLTNKGIISTS